MRSNRLIKLIIFGLSCFFIYLIIPSFVGVSKVCIYINIGVIVYIAFSVLGAYEFYKGEEFSLGIQMYRIKSLKEDSSNFNVWHRRIGVFILVFLALAVLVVSVKGVWCLNQ